MAPIGTPLMFPVAHAGRSYLSSPSASAENSHRPEHMLSVGLSTHSTKNHVRPLGECGARMAGGTRLPAVPATLRALWVPQPALHFSPDPAHPRPPPLPLPPTPHP